MRNRCLNLACFYIFFLAFSIFKQGVTWAAPREAAETRLPVYRIPLYVHLQESGRPPADYGPIFQEINRIWLEQAGICFEITIVMHNRLAEDGFDMFFAPDIGVYNGYYDGEKIWMRDTPRLNPANNPSRHPTARTAAHELGHALGLCHQQDSDENLMRSKTFGWQLSEEEIELAREDALFYALDDLELSECAPCKEIETERLSQAGP